MAKSWSGSVIVTCSRGYTTFETGLLRLEFSLPVNRESVRPYAPSPPISMNLRFRTGKTTWLWFSLVCLISKGETVLIYADGQAHLFHGGCVYVRKEEYPSLPEVGPVWCLIDADGNGGMPPEFLVGDGGTGFPVQASSPNKRRYATWVKNRTAVVYGMSLWSEAELIQG